MTLTKSSSPRSGYGLLVEARGDHPDLDRRPDEVRSARDFELSLLGSRGAREAARQEKRQITRQAICRPAGDSDAPHQSFSTVS
jgi:hypothetical protein